MIPGLGRLPLNVFMNTLSTLVNALAGFITLPFLIAGLGAEGYGYWALIVATMGYFLVLDFGVSGAVGRLVAGSRSHPDPDRTSVVVSTTLALLLLIGVAVALVTLAIPSLFSAVFDVPADRRADVAAALLVMGFTSALYFPAAAFYGVLWGRERFDVFNFVEVPVLIGRAASILIIVHAGSSLLDLALVVAGWTVAGYIARAVLSFRIEPTLRIGPSYLSRGVVGEIFSFGTWFGLLTAIRQTMPQVATFVIGWGLGPVAVTTFTIPRLLASYSNWFLVSATQVVAPRAAAYHYGGDEDRQRALFVEGGRYSFALSLFFVAGLVLLGYPLLEAWQPEDQGQEYRLLVVLMLGELVPMSQWITYNTVVGVGRHRRLVTYGALEIGAILAAALAVMPVFGLIGVAAVVAFAGFLFRGVLQLVFGCRVAGVRPWAYVRSVFGAVGLAAVPPLVLAGGLVAIIEPEGWIEVLLTGTAYGVLYWSIVGPSLVGLARTRALLVRLATRRSRSADAADTITRPGTRPDVEPAPKEGSPAHDRAMASPG